MDDRTFHYFFKFFSGVFSDGGSTDQLRGLILMMQVYSSFLRGGTPYRGGVQRSSVPLTSDQCLDLLRDLEKTQKLSSLFRQPQS